MDTTKKLKHIYDKSYLLPTLGPVSSLYNSQLQKAAGSKGHEMPPSFEGKSCGHCSAVFIPGLNMTMRVVFRKKSKSVKKSERSEKEWKPRDRKLRYYCHSCQKSTTFDLLKPEAKTEDMEKFVAEWKLPNQVKKETSGKDRAKKRKKNSLSNLLTSKKQKDEEDKKKSSLLSLEEFMKG